MNVGVRLFVVSGALAVVFACSGSDSPDVNPTPTADAGASETASSSDGSGSSDAPSSADATAKDVTSPPQDASPSDVAACKAKAATNPKPACANCACDHCLTELVACDANPKCVSLRECAQKNGCCDELCVLIKCPNELNAAGGVGGPGTNQASAVKNCTEQNTCNCCG